MAVFLFSSFKTSAIYIVECSTVFIIDEKNFLKVVHMDRVVDLVN